MSQHTRERALRTLVAAILSSGLNPNEIKEVSRALKTDRSMSLQLARMMDSIVDSLTVPSEPKRMTPNTTESPSPSIKRFLREAGAVTLPKEDLIRRLQSYAQHPEWNPSTKDSQSSILEEFLAIAPRSSWQPALTALQAGPIERDPYVDMIMTRAKASSE